MQVIKSEGLIYMVLEYGDIDLAPAAAAHEAAQREGGSTELDENFIRLYWQQMLQARHLSLCGPLQPLALPPARLESCKVT